MTGTPPWVEPLCRIALTSRSDGPSIREQFHAAKPDLTDEASFSALVCVFLTLHPSLCDRWQEYVDDKRSAPSPRLDLRGPTTSWITLSGQGFCSRTFGGAIDACSHFLWMEANWVLRKTRTWSASVPITELLALGPQESVDTSLERFRIAQGLQHRDCIDLVALVVARQFLDDKLSFSEGDDILNRLWARITNDLIQHSQMPELACEIFYAFDAGEYDHGDRKDPVEKYTVPVLRNIIADFGA